MNTSDDIHNAQVIERTWRILALCLSCVAAAIGLALVMSLFAYDQLYERIEQQDREVGCRNAPAVEAEVAMAAVVETIAELIIAPEEREDAIRRELERQVVALHDSLDRRLASLSECNE